MNSSKSTVETLSWVGDLDGHLRMIDQTKLPGEFLEIDCIEIQEVWDAIKQLKVRGAPAIGIAAAYGVCLAAKNAIQTGAQDPQQVTQEQADYLATSRPTAVNLFWALNRMKPVIQSDATDPADWQRRLLAEAKEIHEEDRRMCHRIGECGAALLSDGDSVLTHCNAGGLATAEYGTALSVFFTAQDQGKSLHVFVDETRPLLQGARLTAWELRQREVNCTLICDSMAAQVMKEGRVQAVITGADRIAANGDSANKIGTYSLAVLAKHHGVPFYIAAPTSTFDLDLEHGDQIPIELRESAEITDGFGRSTAPSGVPVYNPAFDVTPSELIQGIITDRGLIDPVNASRIQEVVAD
ncbi:MAG: S-methyl-5-thioribose-1-phosphate isomerase [Planctomycetota bacterium]|nr:S-methyl-5-thioribose-1-phosphate isomerase [Planctomycetota bacterium]MEE3033699.1 S-methyl-5-thioribose-1-phosphate isomerase [Planctomycetota bacterium]